MDMVRIGFHCISGFNVRAAEKSRVNLWFNKNLTRIFYRKITQVNTRIFPRIYLREPCDFVRTADLSLNNFNHKPPRCARFAWTYLFHISILVQRQTKNNLTFRFLSYITENHRKTINSSFPAPRNICKCCGFNKIFLYCAGVECPQLERERREPGDQLHQDRGHRPRPLLGRTPPQETCKFYSYLVKIYENVLAAPCGFTRLCPNPNSVAISGLKVA